MAIIHYTLIILRNEVEQILSNLTHKKLDTKSVNHCDRWCSILQFIDKHCVCFQCEDILYAAAYCTFWHTLADESLPKPEKELISKIAEALRSDKTLYEVSDTPANLIREAAYNRLVDEFCCIPLESSVYRNYIDARIDSLTKQYREFVMEGSSCWNNISWNAFSGKIYPPDDCYYAVGTFGISIYHLIPDAKNWTADKWLDWNLIVSKLGSLYGYRYDIDPDELDKLLNTAATVWGYDPNGEEPYDQVEVLMKNFPYDLAETLWPSKTFVHIQNALNYTSNQISYSLQHSALCKNPHIPGNIQNTGIYRLVQEINTGNNYELKKKAFDSIMLP